MRDPSGLDAEIVAGAEAAYVYHRHVEGHLCACGMPGPCPQWRVARQVLLRAGMLDEPSAIKPQAVHPLEVGGAADRRG